MKTKKLNFEDFTQEKLSINQISTIKAGWDPKGPPPTNSTGNGSGNNGTMCYYDFEGVLLYCTIDPNFPQEVTH